MEKEFTENWNTFCQCIKKPIADLNELNLSILNDLAKTNAFEAFSQAKKPEDFLSAQAKITKATCFEAAKYSQKMMEISLNAISNASKVWMDLLNTTATKATDHYKSMNTSKSKE